MKADKWFLFFAFLSMLLVMAKPAQALRVGQDCIIDGKKQTCPAFVNSVTLWDESQPDRPSATDDVFTSDDWENFDEEVGIFPAPRTINTNWEAMGNLDKMANIRLWQACGPTVSNLGAYSFVGQGLNNIIWKPVQKDNNCFCRLRFEVVGEDDKTVYGYSTTRPIRICHTLKAIRPDVFLKGVKMSSYYTIVSFDIDTLGNDSQVEVLLHIYPEIKTADFDSFPGDSPYLAYKSTFNTVGRKTAIIANFRKGCIRLQYKNLAGTFSGSTICASAPGRIFTPPTVQTNNYNEKQLGSSQRPIVSGYVSDLGGDNDVRAWIAIKDRSTGKFLPNIVGPFVQKKGEIKGALPVNSQNLNFCYQVRALNRAGFAIGREVCANKKFIQVETIDINPQPSKDVGTTYFKPMRALVKNIELDQRHLPLTVWFHVYEAERKKFANSSDIYYECNEKYINESSIKYGLETYPVEYLKRYDFANFTLQSDAAKNLKPNTEYCYQVFVQNNLSTGKGRPVMIKTRGGNKVDYEPTVFDKDAIVYEPLGSNKVEFQGRLAYIGVNSGKYKNEATCWFEIGRCDNFDATKKKSKEQRFTRDDSVIEATFDNIIKDLALRPEYSYCFQTRCRNGAGKENTIKSDYVRKTFVVHNPLKVETLPVEDEDVGNYTANLSLDIRGRGENGTIMAWIFVYKAQAFKTNGQPDCAVEPKWSESGPKSEMQIGKITIKDENIGNPIKGFHFENLSLGSYYCYQARLQNTSQSVQVVAGERLFFQTQGSRAPKIQTLPVDEKSITQNSATISAKLLAHGNDNSATDIWLWGFQAEIDELGKPICNILKAEAALAREKTDNSLVKKYIFREVGYKKNAQLKHDNQPTIIGTARNLTPGAYYCYQALAKGGERIGKGEYRWFKLQDSKPEFILFESNRVNTQKDPLGNRAMYNAELRVDNSGNGLNKVKVLARWWNGAKQAPLANVGWGKPGDGEFSVLGDDGFYYVGPLSFDVGTTSQISIGKVAESAGGYLLEKGREYYYQIQVGQINGSNFAISKPDKKFSIRLNDPIVKLQDPEMIIGSASSSVVTFVGYVDLMGANEAEVNVEYSAIDWASECGKISSSNGYDAGNFPNSCNTWLKPFYDKNVKFVSKMSYPVLIGSKSVNHIFRIVQNLPSKGIYKYRAIAKTDCLNTGKKDCVGYSKWRIVQPSALVQEFKQVPSGCLVYSVAMLFRYWIDNNQTTNKIWTDNVKYDATYWHIADYASKNGAPAFCGLTWGFPYGKQGECLALDIEASNSDSIDTIYDKYLSKGIPVMARCTSANGQHFIVVRGVKYAIGRQTPTPNDFIFISDPAEARENSSPLLERKSTGNIYHTRKEFLGPGYYCGEGGGGYDGAEYTIFLPKENPDTSGCDYSIPGG